MLGFKSYLDDITEADIAAKKHIQPDIVATYHNTQFSKQDPDAIKRQYKEFTSPSDKEFTGQSETVVYREVYALR